MRIEDGIDLLRTHFKQHPVTGKPGVMIDPRCCGIIAECGGGKSPVEDGGMWMRDKNTLKPLDKNNHALKALAYYLVDKFGYVKYNGKERFEMRVIGKALTET